MVLTVRANLRQLANIRNLLVIKMPDSLIFSHYVINKFAKRSR